MAIFNEDTRVKIPATIQFMRIGYDYQSLKDIDLNAGSRIAINRFAPAIRKINGKNYSDAEILAIIEDIHSVIRNNDITGLFSSISLMRTASRINLLMGKWSGTVN